jgi:hypothetical protein
MSNQAEILTIPGKKVTPQEERISMAGLLKILAAFSVAAGISLHFLGHVSHETYLRLWGLDTGLFQKPAYWTSVNGYYTFFDRVVSGFTILVESWKTLGLLWLVAIGLVSYLSFLTFFSETPTPKKLRDWTARLPAWLQRTCVCIGVSTAFTMFVPAALLLIAISLAIPEYLGDSHGKAAFEKDIARFRNGCESSEPRLICLEILRDGESIANGFLIDSSATHIALFDVDRQNARIIERSGTEISSTPKAAGHALPTK